MAFGLTDPVSGFTAGVDGANSMKVTPRHPLATGAYRMCSYTGLLTAVAAGSATAGHLFAAHWTHATKMALITSFRARWQTATGFTAAQETGLDLFVARPMSVAHTGGTLLTMAGDAFKKRGAHATHSMASVRVSTTGALTNGTNTLDANPVAASFGSELAAAATVPKGAFELNLSVNDLAMHPLILSFNNGLVLRNVIAMGAGGTARVAIEMDWLEVDAY